MRPLRVIATVAAVLLAAGCGQAGQAPSAGQPGPSSPATAQPSLPSMDTGGTVLPKSQVDTSGLPAFYTMTDVQVSSDGKSVTVYGMARDSCSNVEGKAEETATTVKIVISPMPTPQGGPVDQMCTQMLTPKPVTVQLRAPVGDRKVVVVEEGF